MRHRTFVIKHLADPIEITFHGIAYVEWPENFAQVHMIDGQKFEIVLEEDERNFLKWMREMRTIENLTWWERIFHRGRPKGK